MYRTVAMSLSLALLAACASTQPSTSSLAIREIGYPEGSLGLRAIAHQDWSAAEAQLTAPGRIKEDDPARLLNLAHVYMMTGRHDAAVRTYERVLALEEAQQVELANGRVASPHELARAALVSAPAR